MKFTILQSADVVEILLNGESVLRHRLDWPEDLEKDFTSFLKKLFPDSEISFEEVY